MPRFAPVAPIQVLEGLYAHSPKTLGSYHLLLAHHTVEHKARFRDLFQRASDDGHELNIIMDNSIVELGEAVNTEMIREAVLTVQAPGHTVYPVLPDVMGKGKETLAAIDEVYADWELHMAGQGFMAVVQGEDLGDFFASLYTLADTEKYPAISILGVPRILHKTCGSRIRPAAAVASLETDHQIHFLGFSDDIVDDIDSCRLVPNSGIDSAVPLRFRELFTQFADAGKRAPDWFETAQVDVRMIENLQIARALFQDN